MNNLNEIRSILARLLSLENITVRHGDYRTAFFDTKKRILGLPIWKDRGKEVYDLLVGHEVGHALFTPIVDFASIPGVPKSYINVVEDIRIERLIQDKYPGLIRQFKLGYEKLFGSNFFETKGKDLSKMFFPDRVNLLAKVGFEQTKISFADRELEIWEQCQSAETFDEVVEAARAMAEYARQEQREPEQNPASNSDGSDASAAGPDDQKPSSKKQKTAIEKNGDPKKDDSVDKSKSEDKLDYDEQSVENADKLEDSSDESDSANALDKIEGDPIASDDIPDGKAQVSKSSSIGRKGATTEAPPEISTSRSLEQALKDLVDDSPISNRTFAALEPTDRQVDTVVIDYKRVMASRSDKVYVSFSSFLKRTKKFVAVLAREFEMRKAAFQYSRATVAKTGTLNMNRLHAYRYSDDVFLSATRLADAKSHGLVMFVDFSSSMASIIGKVYIQVINTALFCRMTGIPCEIYGFTDGYSSVAGRDPALLHGEGYTYLNNVRLIHLVSSSMSKTEFSRAVAGMYGRSRSTANMSGIEEMGGTPLNETLLAAHSIVRRFQSKHRIEKTSVLVVTDGEANSIDFIGDSAFDGVRIGTSRGLIRPNRIEMSLNGRKFCSTTHSNALTAALVKHLRLTTDCRVLGFFICDSLSGELQKAYQIGDMKLDSSTSNRLYQEFSNAGVAVIPGGRGYDQYFVISEKSLQVNDSDFSDVSSGDTVETVQQSFSDYAASKRYTRVFATRFAESIA